VLDSVLLGSVVDQNVQAAQLAHHARDQLLAGRLVTDVSGHRHRFAARLLNEGDHLAASGSSAGR